MYHTTHIIRSTVAAAFMLGASLFGGDHKSSYPRNVSLSEAVCLMLEYEPELNAAEYDTLSTIGDHRIARADLRPQVSVNSSIGFNDRDRTTDGLFQSGESLLQREIGISVRQLLYDGGVSLNNSLATENANLAQQLTEKGQIEARVVDLSEVYLEVLRVRRQIALAERNLDNHIAMRDMLKERALAGGSRADVGLVQGRLQLAANTLSTQRLSLQRAEARFERLTGVAPGSLTYPSIPSLPSSWKHVDLSQNYNLLAAKEGLESAEHRFIATKGRNKPRVYLDAGVTRGENTLGIRGTDNSASALIVGEWDIFTGGRNRGFESRELYQVGKFEELVRAAQIEGKYQLKLRWQEMEGSQSSYSALSRYAEELAQVTSDYEDQFRIGRQELLNILDIQQEYYSATSRLLDSSFDKDQSVYRIMGMQGTLTKTLIGNSCLAKHCKTDVCSTNCHPHNRRPVTQACLIAEKFDGNGPIADIEPTTRQAFYVDKQQLPLDCDCEGDNGPGKLVRQIGFKGTKQPLKKLFKKRCEACDDSITSKKKPLFSKWGK